MSCSREAVSIAVQILFNYVSINKSNSNRNETDDELKSRTGKTIKPSFDSNSTWGV